MKLKCFTVFFSSIFTYLSFAVEPSYMMFDNIPGNTMMLMNPVAYVDSKVLEVSGVTPFVVTNISANVTTSIVTRAYVERYLGIGASAETMTNIANDRIVKVVTKRYVENLGIRGEVNSNDVIHIVDGKILVVTNDVNASIAAATNGTVRAATTIDAEYIQIGTDASVGHYASNEAIAIGNGAQADGVNNTHQCIAIGEHAYAGWLTNENGQIEKVKDSVLQGDSAIAIGSKARAYGKRGVSIGYRTANYGISAVAIGSAEPTMPNGKPWYITMASNDYTIAIGHNAQALAKNAAQIGWGTNDVANTLKFQNTTIVDANGNVIASEPKLIALTNSSIVAMGNRAYIRDGVSSAIAIGFQSVVSNTDGFAIGSYARIGVPDLTNGVHQSAGGAMQLGNGCNTEPRTLKFRNSTIVNGNGKIPTASLEIKSSFEDISNRVVVLEKGGGEIEGYRALTNLDVYGYTYGTNAMWHIDWLSEGFKTPLGQPEADASYCLRWYTEDPNFYYKAEGVYRPWYTNQIANFYYVIAAQEIYTNVMRAVYRYDTKWGVVGKLSTDKSTAIDISGWISQTNMDKFISPMPNSIVGKISNASVSIQVENDIFSLKDGTNVIWASNASHSSLTNSSAYDLLAVSNATDITTKNTNSIAYLVTHQPIIGGGYLSVTGGTLTGKLDIRNAIEHTYESRKYSIPIGNVTASGGGSIAIGHNNTTASGDDSIAIGLYATATEMGAIAIGGNGSDGFAMPVSATARGAVQIGGGVNSEVNTLKFGDPNRSFNTTIVNGEGKIPNESLELMPLFSYVSNKVESTHSAVSNIVDDAIGTRISEYRALTNLNVYAFVTNGTIKTEWVVDKYLVEGLPPPVGQPITYGESKVPMWWYTADPDFYYKSEDVIEDVAYFYYSSHGQEVFEDVMIAKHPDSYILKENGDMLASTNDAANIAREIVAEDEWELDVTELKVTNKTGRIITRHTAHERLIENGNITNYNGAAYYQYRLYPSTSTTNNVGEDSLKEIIRLDSKITNLWANCFRMCSSLKIANLPNVTGLIPSNIASPYGDYGGRQFQLCQNLEYVYLPKLKTVSHAMFDGSCKIKEIHLPSATTFVGSAQFQSTGTNAVIFLDSISTNTCLPLAANTFKAKVQTIYKCADGEVYHDGSSWTTR